jgi:tRNA-uridine 2-sulfurtransferase
MRVAVAMSGGVDSSVAAVLLKEMGHEVYGVTAKILMCADMDGCEPRFDVCCSPESIRDAKDTARRFGIPHTVLDVEDDFSREVIDPFCREYLQGRTPSPCIHCNARIKFKKLIEFAHSIGCEKLVTGHYAGVSETAFGRYYVSMGSDRGKDQSYFLFSLDQDILRNVLFPLGGYRKEEIRALAARHALPVAHKPESQEICFVLDNDYPRYIERRTGVVPPPGDIVDTEGRVLGRHRGIHRYTVGQRRGLGIAALEPLYVISIDVARNLIVAGPRKSLLRDGLIAVDVTVMKTESLHGLRVLVRTRSSQPPFTAALEEIPEGIIARFDEPQAGITPGQAAVFYDDDGGILGGGWISRSL